jgi:hypothetical protein
MKVTLSLSGQQTVVLVAALAERPVAPGNILEQFAAAFDEYCRDHPEQAGARPDDV